VSELDELVRNRRFDEIHEARRQVIDDERSINEALATGQIGDAQGRRLYQRAVDAYVRELEYLLNAPGDDTRNKYWHNERIGSVQLPGDNDAVVVEGLGEYLDLPEELAARVRTTTRERYYEGGEQAVRTVAVQPSWRLLKSAFRTANKAVAGLGLEIEVSEEQRTEITDELMEEVEQWRRANL